VRSWRTQCAGAGCAASHPRTSPCIHHPGGNTQESEAARKLATQTAFSDFVRSIGDAPPPTVVMRVHAAIPNRQQQHLSHARDDVRSDSQRA
jgi:hypothetical protein